MTTMLFDRIATLLKADAHGIVESLEERSLLLKQYVREAEIELNHKRARLDALREEEHRLREGLAQAEADLARLEEDVSLALAGGKDDLARFAIRRLLPRRGEAAATRTRLDEIGVEARTLAERLEAQQAQHEALRTRVRAELARGEAGTTSSWSCVLPVADEEVELELLRRRQGPGGTR